MKAVRRAVHARGNVKLEGHRALLVVRISCDMVLESDAAERSFQFVKILSALLQSCGVADACGGKWHMHAMCWRDNHKATMASKHFMTECFTFGLSVSLF